MKRRNKKTEIQRLKEENELLRSRNVSWQDAHADMCKRFHDVLDRYWKLEGELADAKRR